MFCPTKKISTSSVTSATAMAATAVAAGSRLLLPHSSRSNKTAVFVVLKKRSPFNPISSSSSGCALQLHRFSSSSSSFLYSLPSSSAAASSSFSSSSSSRSVNPSPSPCNNNNNIGTTNYKHGNNSEVQKGSKEESLGMRRCGRNDSSLSSSFLHKKLQIFSVLSSSSSSFEERKTKKKKRECADFFFSRRRFSSSSAAAAGSGSSKLSETIANEIEHEGSSYQPPPLLQKYLQKSGFSLEEKDNDVNMTLSKTTPDGRKVTVEFQLVSPFQPDGEEDEEGGGGNAEGGGASGSGGSGAAGSGGEMTDFSVTIEEQTNGGGNNDSSSSSSSASTSSGSAAVGGGRGLTFFCTTLQNDDKFRFVVGNVRYFNNAEEKNSAFGYNGPEFEDLDDNFQEGLDEWLGEVGVDSSLCDFIDAAAIDKEHREYVRWLKNVKAFVSSSSSSSVLSGGGATTGASAGGGK